MQRDVVRLGVVSILVTFSVSPKWLSVGMFQSAYRRSYGEEDLFYGME